MSPPDTACVLLVRWFAKGGRLFSPIVAHPIRANRRERWRPSLVWTMLSRMKHRATHTARAR